ncbi:MAG: hypothetical protein AUH91_00885 [Verrucomicrobia bacterium 13_1_40CM_4_54_4]|nr:MAG: hypothetical protein AUH91_00885 [Verrucomicrobia bacterium 13_1_40CM_4_54_4]
MRSALIAKISGAKEIYGMSDAQRGSRLFYARVAKINRHGHAVNRYLKLAECAGATVGELLRCPLPTGDPLPRFDEYPPFILLNPIARVEGESLSNAVIAEFCYALAPTRLVVVGQSRRKIDTPENCVDLTNRTSLLQLIRLIRIARFVASTVAYYQSTPGLIRVGSVPTIPTPGFGKTVNSAASTDSTPRGCEDAAVALGPKMSQP